MQVFFMLSNAVRCIYAALEHSQDSRHPLTDETAARIRYAIYVR